MEKSHVAASVNYIWNFLKSPTHQFSITLNGDREFVVEIAFDDMDVYGRFGDVVWKPHPREKIIQVYYTPKAGVNDEFLKFLAIKTYAAIYLCMRNCLIEEEPLDAMILTYCMLIDGWHRLFDIDVISKHYITALGVRLTADDKPLGIMVDEAIRSRRKATDRLIKSASKLIDHGFHEEERPIDDRIRELYDAIARAYTKEKEVENSEHDA